MRPTMKTSLFPASWLSALLLMAGLLVGCGEPEAARSAQVLVAKGPQSIPKIDLHTHYRADHPNLGLTLEDWNMRAALITVSRPGLRGREESYQLKQTYPDRFIWGTSFDASRVAEPDFVDSTLAQLRYDLDRGAKLVKVWKNVGLEIKDADGSWVQIDDERFQPIWDFLADRDVPVLAHIGEPRAAWQPLDQRSPHYHYYSRHPEFHAYNLPEMPRWEEVIEARDNWLCANPDLTVIGAHLGSMAHDVDQIRARLDSFPNFHVETAERFGDLVNQPSEDVRQFMIDYQDRILYGTDVSTPDAELGRLDTILTLHWDYLTSADSVLFDNRKIMFRGRTRGLNLPEAVLRKIYHDNAVRLLRLADA